MASRKKLDGLTEEADAAWSDEEAHNYQDYTPQDLAAHDRDDASDNENNCENPE